ncbi:MAG: GAF domain-containing protein, partial [Actinomycetes bacterium]
MSDFRRRLRAAIAQAVDPAPAMQRIVDASLALVESADGAILEMLDGDDLVGVCAAGTLRPHLGRPPGPGLGLAGPALRSGDVQRSDNTSSDRRVDREACRWLGARSLITVPLHTPGRTLGALTVTAPVPHGLTEAQATALATLADFVATTIAGAEDVARRAHEVLAVGPTQ